MFLKARTALGTPAARRGRARFAADQDRVHRVRCFGPERWCRTINAAHSNYEHPSEWATPLVYLHTLLTCARRASSTKQFRRLRFFGACGSISEEHVWAELCHLQDSIAAEATGVLPCAKRAPPPLLALLAALLASLLASLAPGALAPGALAPGGEWREVSRRAPASGLFAELTWAQVANCSRV